MLLQAELHGSVDGGRGGFAVDAGGLESPFLDGAEGFFVEQRRPGGSGDGGFGDFAVRGHGDPDDDGTCNSLLAGGDGVLRGGHFDENGSF